jgi:hypothetical protein
MNGSLATIVLAILGFLEFWVGQKAFRELHTYRYPVEGMHDDRHQAPPAPQKKSALNLVFWFSLAIFGGALWLFVLLKSGFITQWMPASSEF